MEDPETWRWIWLIAAAVFLGGEIVVVGTFFLLPFGIGAVVATGAAFLGANIAVQWSLFVAVSGASFAAFRPLAKRLDEQESADGIGAKRLIGQTGVVIETISGGADGIGRVRVLREEWRAEAESGGPIAHGTTIEVADVQGTRAIVRPLKS